MKQFAQLLGCAAVFVAALATQSMAQTGNGRFDGGGVMHSFSQACLNGGWPGHADQVLVRFHPNGVGNNGDWESIILSRTSWSIGTTIFGGAFSGVWQAAEHGGNFSRPWLIPQGDSNHADIRVLSMWPRVINETTDEPVTIRGQIRHLSGTQWCRVSFDVIVSQQMN